MWGGRGRMGRKWFANRGGLWFTVLLRPPQFRNLHILSLATGLSVAKALKTLFSVEARVKWPNDVLIDEKRSVEYLLRLELRLIKSTTSYLG
jgi:BirA family biotin operon repressor/biotin-[acetyl-CoA-carboxylase] ligase